MGKDANITLVEDHPWTIPSKFGPNFNGEDFLIVDRCMMDNRKNSHGFLGQGVKNNLKCSVNNTTPSNHSHSIDYNCKVPVAFQIKHITWDA